MNKNDRPQPKMNFELWEVLDCALADAIKKAKAGRLRAKYSKHELEQIEEIRRQLYEGDASAAVAAYNIYKENWYVGLHIYDLTRKFDRVNRILQDELSLKEIARAQVAADRDAKLKRIKREITVVQESARQRNQTIAQLRIEISRLKERIEKLITADADERAAKLLSRLEKTVSEVQEYIWGTKIKIAVAFLVGLLIGVLA